MSGEKQWDAKDYEKFRETHAQKKKKSERVEKFAAREVEDSKGIQYVVMTNGEIRRATPKLRGKRFRKIENKLRRRDRERQNAR